jgi:hypothetical protein
MSAAHGAAVQLLNDAKLAGDAGQKLVRGLCSSALRSTCKMLRTSLTAALTVRVRPRCAQLALQRLNELFIKEPALLQHFGAALLELQARAPQHSGRQRGLWRVLGSHFRARAGGASGGCAQVPGGQAA